MNRKKLFLVVPFVAIALVVYGVALFTTADAAEMAGETDTVAVDTRSHQVQQDTVEGGDLKGGGECVCQGAQECRPLCHGGGCLCYPLLDLCRDQFPCPY